MDSWLDAETARVLLVTLGVMTTALSTVAVALANRTRAHAKASRVQLENNHIDPETGHVINLREEGDERHADLAKAINQVLVYVKTFRRDVFNELRTLRNDLSREAERIHELEQTQERKGGKTE